MSYFIYKELSNKVLNLAFAVHSRMGPGLLESAYEGAFCVELKYACIPFIRQKVYPLVYKSEYIGAYIADIVIDDKIIIELKSVKSLSPLMEAQLINYLKLSGIHVGYLFNFNALRLTWKRYVNKRE